MAFISILNKPMKNKFAWLLLPNCDPAHEVCSEIDFAWLLLLVVAH
jgi:hypothetical protein